MEVRLIPDTSIIEVRIFSLSPNEAAEIANSIAAAYSKYSADGGRLRAEVVDKAIPGLRPVRPNKVLNISAGFVLGLLAGGGFGLLSAWAVARMSRRRAEDSARNQFPKPGPPLQAD